MNGFLLSLKKTLYPTLVTVLLLCLLTGCSQKALSETALSSSSLVISDLSEETLQNAASLLTVQTNDYASLSVPTDFQKFGDYYFLVDCYHNQVLYCTKKDAPLTEWSVMTSDTTYPHTISSDGTVYLITDTDANRVLIFEEYEGVFIHTQTFEEIGSRPHYSVYDEEEGIFYVWSSMTGEMYLFERDKNDNRMYLTQIQNVEELTNNYIRSFCIEGDSIYFVSGMTTDGSTETAAILKCRLRDFKVEARYPVPDEIAGMACLKKIEDDWYITVSTDAAGSQDAATILRTGDLSSLENGDWEDLYQTYFEGGGTPYSITEIDGAWYLTEHRLTTHALWEFYTEDGVITDVRSIY